MLYRNSRIVIRKIIFLILCFFEFIYKVIFAVVYWIKKSRRLYTVSWAKVIAVGNLSVGGTGKSVFASFLIKALKGKQGAIILRGYKGSFAITGKNFLVSDGNKLFCSVDVCGDEAFMMAIGLSVPVVVGKRRQASCQLLEQFFGDKKKPDFLVFDDSYQNHQVKKDCEILLLDARHPFENGHCLPAGRLREKDYTRADIIILTHADRVGLRQINKIKESFLRNFNQQAIFTGKHSWQALLLFNEGKDQTDMLKNKRVIVCAGIGSFGNFKEAVECKEILVSQTYQLPDHHIYTKQDLNFLAQKMNQNNLVGIVTTLKDWWKIKPFLTLLPYQHLPVYVVCIEFEFLSKQEYHHFMLLLNQKTKLLID